MHSSKPTGNRSPNPTVEIVLIVKPATVPSAPWGVLRCPSAVWKGFFGVFQGRPPPHMGGQKEKGKKSHINFLATILGLDVLFFALCGPRGALR